MEISVIVPVYNVEQYLDRCVKSILGQTFKNFEVILINDGSIDNSANICNMYSKKDKRVRVVHKKNEGVSKARNLGINLSKGKYLVFVDSDDWIEDDFLELLYKGIKKLGTDIVISGYVYEKHGKIKNNFKKGVEKIFSRDEIRYEFFKQDKFLWTIYDKIFKKELFVNKNFNINLKIGEDMLLCWQLLNSVNNIGYIPLYKYHYDISASNTMTSKFSLKWFHGLRVKKRIYNEVKDFSKELKCLSNIVCVVEAMTLLKISQKSSKYNTDRLTKLLKSFLRKNIYVIFLYPRSNIMTIRQRIGIVYFSLPNKFIKLLIEFIK